MHIFIDESGTFSAGSGAHNISVVGALIIPDSCLKRVERKYKKIRPKLPKDKGEVKGRLLNEAEIDRVVEMLVKFDVLFEITAFDIGNDTEMEKDLNYHRTIQAEKITENLKETMHPQFVKSVWEMRKRLEVMSLSLYAQSIATFDLIERIIHHATLYYVQRIPKELAAFHWVIDAKGTQIKTDWEDWWSQMTPPFLQSRSLKKPYSWLIGADYSYFERFNMKQLDYLKTHLPKDHKDEATDLKKLLNESFRFSPDNSCGLELCDVLTNAVRRALIGNLGISGWGKIRRLMVNTKQQYIHVLRTKSADIDPQNAPYLPVMRHFRKYGKSMIV